MGTYLRNKETMLIICIYENTIETHYSVFCFFSCLWWEGGESFIVNADICQRKTPESTALRLTLWSRSLLLCLAKLARALGARLSWTPVLGLQAYRDLKVGSHACTTKDFHPQSHPSRSQNLLFFPTLTLILILLLTHAQLLVFGLLEQLSQVTFATVLSVKVTAHGISSTTFIRRRLDKGNKFCICIHLTVFQHSKLSLSPMLILPGEERLVFSAPPWSLNTGLVESPWMLRLDKVGHLPTDY